MTAHETSHHFWSALRLALGTALVFAIAAPVAVQAQCMPRFISQNIEDAVTALTASRYCPNLPYTIAEASQRIDLMRACNVGASERIDEMLNGNEDRYRRIYTDDPQKIACQAAATIALH